MEWSEEGIVLGARRHGEGHAILELVTRARGRHLGMVRGGASRQKAPLLQAGNKVHATWKARLDEHLGTYTIEAVALRAEGLMTAPHGAYGVTHMAQLLHLLPERDPHGGLYDTLDAVLDAFAEPVAAGMLMARFELAMLRELGFGLALEECAATGGRNDLAYVSPKSGRAVSRLAGEPYAARLFPLPGFLIGGIDADLPAPETVEAALKITGHFLQVRAFEPRGLRLPEARAGFMAALRRAAERLSS